MIAILARWARPRWILTALAALLTVSFFAFGPGAAYQQLKTDWPDSPILDEQAFAAADAMLDTLREIGEQGRALYGRFLALDFAFLACHALFAALLIHDACVRCFPERRGLPRLSLVPLAAGLLDVLENLAFLALLIRFPARDETLATAAGALAGLKLLAAAAVMLLVLAALASLAWRGLRRVTGRAAARAA